MICPHCHKDWWLRVANSEMLICGCGYQYYEPEPEPSKAEIRLLYPADHPKCQNAQDPRPCSDCGNMFEPHNSSHSRCPSCTTAHERASRNAANRRYRKKKQKERRMAL